MRIKRRAGLPPKSLPCNPFLENRSGQDNPIKRPSLDEFIEANRKPINALAHETSAFTRYNDCESEHLVETLSGGVGLLKDRASLIVVAKFSFSADAAKCAVKKLDGDFAALNIIADFSGYDPNRSVALRHLEAVLDTISNTESLCIIVKRSPNDRAVAAALQKLLKKAERTNDKRALWKIGSQLTSELQGEGITGYDKMAEKRDECLEALKEMGNGEETSYDLPPGEYCLRYNTLRTLYKRMRNDPELVEKILNPDFSLRALEEYRDELHKLSKNGKTALKTLRRLAGDIKAYRERASLKKVGTKYVLDEVFRKLSPEPEFLVRMVEHASFFYLGALALRRLESAVFGLEDRKALRLLIENSEIEEVRAVAFDKVGNDSSLLLEIFKSTKFRNPKASQCALDRLSSMVEELADTEALMLVAEKGTADASMRAFLRVRGDIKCLQQLIYSENGRIKAAATEEAILRLDEMGYCMGAEDLIARAAERVDEISNPYVLWAVAMDGPDQSTSSKAFQRLEMMVDRISDQNMLSDIIRSSKSKGVRIAAIGKFDNPQELMLFYRETRNKAIRASIVERLCSIVECGKGLSYDSISPLVAIMRGTADGSQALLALREYARVVTGRKSPVWVPVLGILHDYHTCPPEVALRLMERDRTLLMNSLELIKQDNFPEWMGLCLEMKTFISKHTEERGLGRIPSGLRSLLAYLESRETVLQ